MRILQILLATVLIIPRAQAACGAETVRDWGLHRAWRMTPDCTHRGRPAVLVEVPWTAPEKKGPHVPGSILSLTPLVRAGTKVALTWQRENSDGILAGTALTTAGLGQTVAVQTDVGRRIVHGVVSGPGRVELYSRKAGQ